MIRESLRGEFENIVGKANVLMSGEALKAYSFDGTSNWVREPDVVIFPTSAEEVSKIIKIADRENMPVTPRGGGTNVSGGSIPIMGGIVLAMTKMNRILDINKENMTATVEAGVILQDLAMRLAKEGFFFPPDPQSFLGATMGGVIAENAGGPACLKYGVTKQYILGLEVVLPTGEILHLGGNTLKNVVGYDLQHLFISAEGTLGVVTTANIKINPLPPARKTVIAVYDDVSVAGESVTRTLEAGIVPGKIELIDNWLIKTIEEMTPLGLPQGAAAMLLFESDGIAEAVEKEAEKIVEITKKYGATDVRIAENAEEANRFWMARRAGYAAIFSKAFTVYAEDIVVPRGKVPALIKRCKELAREYDIEIVMLGHAGDGNLHPSLLTDIRDKDHYGRATKAMNAIIEAAVEFGGVLAGEHGIGLEKQKLFMRNVEPAVIDMMKKIKGLLDPKNIMNPGKIWD